MKRRALNGIILTTLCILFTFTWVQAQETKTIKLVEPTKKGGLSIMESFSKRASSRSWADKELSSQDLSNLLWAANGINRADSKKRTAPSAMNVQDVDIYVFLKSGIYLYDAGSHSLNLIVSGDNRTQLGMSGGQRPSSGASGAAGSAPAGAPGSGSTAVPPGGADMPGSAAGAGTSTAPVNLVLVTDLSKMSMGADELKKEMGVIDAAIVSENIALFCAGNNLATVPRIGSINSKKDSLKTLMKLKDTQYIVMENPVGYPAETR